MKTRREFLKYSSVVAGGLLLPDSFGLATKQTNVVLIIVDQMSGKALGKYTPNINKLKESGIYYPNAYCSSPVCGPARSSIFTGLMPSQTNITYNIHTPELAEQAELKENIKTIAECTKVDSYYAGRWHLSPGYQKKGFKQVEDTCFWFCANYKSPAKEIDERVANNVVEFSCQASTPYFLTIGLLNPHDICKWVKKPTSYRSSFSLPANFEADVSEPDFVRKCRNREVYGNEILLTKHWMEMQYRAYREAYFKYVMMADEAVGTIIDTFDDSKTVFIFTSDHGDGMGAHRWVTKLMFYEEIINVPMIISGAGIPKGEVDRRLVSHIDLMPTILGILGDAMPRGYVGLDILGKRRHDAIMAELYPDPRDTSLHATMERGSRYKMIKFSDGSRPMKFDMVDDPFEMNDLLS